jgi:uncharacterized protein YndB with AHSA1/START domain
VTQTRIAPVNLSIHVDCPLDHAFRIFTDAIGTWWPLQTHSAAADTFKGTVRAETVVLEGRLGGRLYERHEDGREVQWGEILIWQPPQRVAFSWHPYLHSGPPTEVDVRFTSEGTGTRVDLEHRGWERLGEEAVEKRRGYEAGWPGVLTRFAEHIGSRIV